VYKMLFEPNFGNTSKLEKQAYEAFCQNHYRTEWIVAVLCDSACYLYICPTQLDAEELLIDFHTEGSHSDETKYEIWHDGQKLNYRITAQIY